MVNHNISVGGLRAAVKRLQQPMGLLLTLVTEYPGRSLLATCDTLCIVGKHVAKQAANDTALTWAEIQVYSLLPLTWTMKARVGRLWAPSPTLLGPELRCSSDLWSKLNCQYDKQRCAGVSFFQEPQCIMNLEEAPISRQW